MSTGGIGGMPPTGFEAPPKGSNDQLSDLLAVLRQCRGAPYQFWNDGGDGMHNNSIADVQQNGESCSGLFVFAFRKIGVDPPFRGTYDAKQNLESAQPYQDGKEYPLGTFVVGVDPGTEGHMVMVSGPGNVTIGSDQANGVNEGKHLSDVVNASYDMKDPVSGTYHVLGTEVAGSGLTIPGVGSALSGMGDQIASGVAKALLRFIRVLYCIVILWPIDWLSGFYWEMTKQVAGFWATASEDVDLLAILKGDEQANIPPLRSPTQGDLTSEENVNRFYTLLLLITTYVLAFGYDRNNQSHLDNLFNAADNANVNKGKKGYNEEATIRATVSRFSGEGNRDGNASETPIRGSARAVPLSGVKSDARGSSNNGSGTRQKPPQEQDAATGRFVKSRNIDQNV